MQSVNPATCAVIKEYAAHTMAQAARLIEQAHACFGEWKTTSFSERAERMQRVAALLRKRKQTLSELMADEMGKPLKDGGDEIEKCAVACEYYAEHAEKLLQDEEIASDARKSFVTYQPLGVILAVMPWNFPFWQVFRFAAPNLMAGNVGLLKHASNVSGCALAIEALFRDAGFLSGCFTTLLVAGKNVNGLIEHELVRAVTLTGSTEAGKKVAAVAGALVKKTVLELGGSDAYVVLADADVKKAAVECAKSRLINNGQSCIAAKRFIVAASIRKEFEQHFIEHCKTLKIGNPRDAGVQLGPLARHDLRDALEEQVQRSIGQGAVVLWQGEAPKCKGAFFPPTVLGGVKPGIAAFEEELFGPVAAIVEAKDEAEAFRLANASPFGLGSAIFSSNLARAEEFAKTHIDAGQTFVNAFVRSDARLPFGGVKESGYGRELSHLGIREFVNAKTVYIG